MDESSDSEDFSGLSESQDVSLNEDTISKEPPEELGRFWNSREDLILVELWSKYAEEVINVGEDKSIYKLFEAEMNRLNIQVNSSEIEIRMQYMWARYLYERNDQIRTGFKSMWRLYPLLECVFESNKIKQNWQNTDEQDEEKVVNELLKEVNTLYKQPGYDFRSAVSVYNNVQFRPIFREISMQKLFQIQCDNARLKEQREQDLQELLLEKEMMKYYESLQENIYANGERLLKFLKLRRLSKQARKKCQQLKKSKQVKV